MARAAADACRCLLLLRRSAQLIICLAGCIPRFHNTFQFRHSTEDGHFNAMKLSPSSLAFFGAVAAVAPGVSAFAPSAASSSPRVMELFATKKVFIDGEAGTTGLQVRDRLGKRTDIEIISPPPELRKDEETRKKFINEADAVILCALKVACRDLCLHAPACAFRVGLQYPFDASCSPTPIIRNQCHFMQRTPQAFPMLPPLRLRRWSIRTTTERSSLMRPLPSVWTMNGRMDSLVSTTLSFSQVDDVVILVHDIIHRMELQDFYLMNKCVVPCPIMYTL